MDIRDHRLVGTEFRALNDFGGEITPRFIVVHYTAGGGADGSHRALAGAGLSAHLLLERDGTTLQCVDFNRKAYHAGESRWRGFRFLNSHSVGIEVCNYGWMLPLGNGKYQRPSRFGATPVFEPENVLVSDHRHGWPRNAGWELYPPAQLQALTEICKALLQAYPQIVDIVGHDDIAPERKQDPGPAMPMHDLRLLLEAREPEATGRRYEVIARSGLNMRAGPGTGHAVVRALPFGQVVTAVDESGEWVSVDLESDGAIDGFVHSGFLRPA